MQINNTRQGRPRATALAGALLAAVIALSACAGGSPAEDEQVRTAPPEPDPVSEPLPELSPDEPPDSEQPDNKQPDDKQEEDPDEEPQRDDRSRTFYRFALEGAVWDEDPAQFPPEWLEAAKQAADAQSENYDSWFTRGWQCDLDGDGRMEGILLQRLWEGNEHMWGNSLFVYVNADGAAEVLTMGQDWQNGDYRNMDAQLLRYQGFSHLFLQSGANNMTSGSFAMIYRESAGALETLFLDSWFSFADSDVFFETQGPHGQGPNHYFWDALEDRYSVVGAQEIPPEQFLREFDAEQIVWEGLRDIDIERLEESPPSAYTADLFASVEVIGNRYYQLLYRESHPQYFTVWKKTADGSWRHEPIPTGPIRFPDKALVVHGVDMTAAEETAIP